MLLLPLPLLLLSVVPSDFLPCTEGLVIEYRAEPDTQITDTILGLAPRNLCRIERVTVRAGGSKQSDAYLREILADRVLAAGYAATPLALRPPLLVGPIAVGTRWQFNRARYRIAAVGPCRVGALRFDRCVTVEMAGDDGSKQRTRFVEGIGLVEQTFGGGTMRAVEVRMPKSKSPRKSSGAPRR